MDTRYHNFQCIDHVLIHAKSIEFCIILFSNLNFYFLLLSFTVVIPIHIYFISSLFDASYIYHQNLLLTFGIKYYYLSIGWLSGFNICIKDGKVPHHSRND